MNLTYEQALAKAAALCSRSEHCEKEIHEKLLRWGLDASEAEKAVDYLRDEKYLDSRRYARAYALDKFRYNHWGRIKIGQMLRMQGIGSAAIDYGLSHIDPHDYLEQLEYALQQKDRQLHDEDPYARKGKLIRHALSRGFEMDLIMNCVEDMGL